MRNETGGNRIATVVVRASTDNIADDIERAIEDGVNAYKVSRAVCIESALGMIGYRDTHIPECSAAKMLEEARRSFGYFWLIRGWELVCAINSSRREDRTGLPRQSCSQVGRMFRVGLELCSYW